VKTLTEQTAEMLLAHHAFAPGVPGFVGAAVDVPGPAGPRRPLRHGFLTSREPGLVTVSGPPSPGLRACLDRMTEDLAQVPDAPAGPASHPAAGSALLPAAGSALHPAAGPSPHPAAGLTPHPGVRVGLEAGLDAAGPLGLTRRWALAGAVAPVLAAAFANSPGSGWRSTRQARHRDLPVIPPGDDPRTAWATYVLDTPGPARVTLRDRLRGGAAIDAGGLARYAGALRPPVAARGHLELDVADRPAGTGWPVVVAVTAALLDDPRAAREAETATAGLTGEPRLWGRAARDALTDPVLAAAARACFLAAYAALARQGAARDLRDAVAGFTERYVMRGRCPADDVMTSVPR
jgi:glutamate--cysteine ligase